MNAISHKAKQFLLVIIKLLVAGFALYYIYQQIETKKPDWSLIHQYLSWKHFCFLSILSFGNWLLEILKWQNLVSYFRKISFIEATKQSLGSLTASIFTPNRIGEYGAKALYYPKKDVKKVIFLNFISNTSQMITTCFFGLLGFILLQIKTSETMFWFVIKIKVSHIVIFLFLIIAAILLFRFKRIEFYGYSIEKLFAKIKDFPSNILVTNFQLATFRYLLFSHQFYYLLTLFDCPINYSIALGCIFLMYFLASILPSIHIMDVAIKSSVAVFLFTKFGIDEWKILTISTLMWFFNLFIPVGIGSYFVFRFKPYKE
ncbi:lysylphosphatidylglycerol synthase domain-containing protein [Flavobacterium sp. J27]|uniref:lysylphosphatidylglycerol synthase domain-containing protein n=1 Tax=Flavobacterium sp. J27 TaxID=2060419 RepID=UPI00102FD931|nr:lysylphosphatidylglycerol synthase domain-containing protein [Flavobacterium sp. J27]